MPSIIKYYFAGKSTPDNKKCDSIYNEGWKTIVDAGYDKPITPDNIDVHHIVAKMRNKQIGVLSWYVDTEYNIAQATVMMAYVKLPYRGKGIFTNMHIKLKTFCKVVNIVDINYTVHTGNYIANKMHRRLGGKVQYQTYVYPARGY